MDVDTNAVPADVAEKINAFKDEAHAKRKKRKMSPSYVTIDALRGFGLFSRGERISSMFTSVALDPESHYDLALFGPEGGLNSVIYDLSTHEWKGQLSDEQGDILDVEWYNRGPITAGSNGTISIWSPEGSIKFKLEAHQGPVVGIDLHPMGGYLASASRDGDWALHDLVNEKTVARFRDNAGSLISKSGLKIAFRCSDLHPDGHVYAMGCEDGSIHVYDMITGQLNGTLGPHDGAVRSLHFSSNGYHLAETSVLDSIVRIWDLRKASSVAFELQGSSVGGKVRWDQSGQFIALGGEQGVEIWAYQKKEKNFEKITAQPLEKTGVQCFEWGLDGKVIACGGLADGSIAVLGIK